MGTTTGTTTRRSTTRPRLRALHVAMLGGVALVATACAGAVGCARRLDLRCPLDAGATGSQGPDRLTVDVGRRPAGQRLRRRCARARGQEAWRHLEARADHGHEGRHQPHPGREAGRTNRRIRRPRVGQRRQLPHRPAGRHLALRMGRRPSKRGVHRTRGSAAVQRLRHPGRRLRGALAQGAVHLRLRLRSRPRTRPRRWTACSSGSRRTPDASPTRRRRTSPGRSSFARRCTRAPVVTRTSRLSSARRRTTPSLRRCGRGSKR